MSWTWKIVGNLDIKSKLLKLMSWAHLIINIIIYLYIYNILFHKGDYQKEINKYYCS